MSMIEFRRGVEQAASTHQGGIKLRPCLRIDPAWFATIVNEVRDLVAKRAPSEVGDKSHPTYWTGPYGRATQHSLFNASGVTSWTTTIGPKGRRSTHRSVRPCTVSCGASKTVC